MDVDDKTGPMRDYGSVAHVDVRITTDQHQSGRHDVMSRTKWNSERNKNVTKSCTWKLMYGCRQNCTQSSRIVLFSCRFYHPHS